MKKKYSSQFCWFMFFISTLFFLYEFVLRVSPGVMADDLMRSFKIDAKSLGFMSSVFFFAYAGLQVPVGILFDRFSSKKLLFIACLLCAIGTLLFAHTTSYWLGVFSRLLTGFGAAFGFVGALKVAEQWLPLNRFALVSGLLLTFGFLGAVVSGNVLEWLISQHGWVPMLTGLGFIGVGLSIIIYFVVQEPVRSCLSQPHMKTGHLLHSVWMVMKDRYIWINGLVGFCMYAPTSAFAELWGKSYLMTVLHFTGQQAVLSVTAIFLGWAIGSPLIGAFSDRSGDRRTLMLVGCVAAAVCSVVVMYYHGLTPTKVFLLLFLFGICSSAELLNFPYAREVNQNEFSATAIALTNMLTVLGAALVQPFMGWLLDYHWTGGIEHGVRIYSPSAYQSAFMMVPLLLLLGALLTLLLKKTNYEINRKL